MDYFGFIDETGNTQQERFFGIGLLVIQEVGTLYDLIYKRAQHIKSVAYEVKRAKVDELTREGNIEEMAKIAKGGKQFELKFDRINFTNREIYQEIITDYFSIPHARFTALVIDKQNPKFKPVSLFPGTWDAYMTYAGMVIAREIVNVDGSGLCILADDITKPTQVKNTFEQELEQKVSRSLTKRGSKQFQLKCARLESHSSLIIQLVDILLGCVLHDFKMKANMVSTRLQERRNEVVQTVKSAIGREDLCGSFTTHKPSYFSVWEMVWKE